MRRVVVTGIGLVTPLGIGIENVWNQLVAGKSGIGRTDYFDVTDYPCKISGQVPRGTLEENKFNSDDWVRKKDQKKYDLFIHYGLAAAKQAIEDSGYTPETDEEKEAVGVMVGSGIGGLDSMYEGAAKVYEGGGLSRLSPFFIPSLLINMVSGLISIEYGFKGPNHAVVTACSSGAHAIGDAGRIIAAGDADVMVAGGAEAGICKLGVKGFCAARTLSTNFNDEPERGSRPWDQNRDGFVMGEGSGILVLEEYEHAKKRGAKIYAELTGYGLSGDAFHITAPAADGNGARRSMQMALKKAQINPEDIDYINAHGTSTPVGDQIEHDAVVSLFGAQPNLCMSSTKSSIGHLLGAAGSVEAIFSILAMQNNIAPPTLNLEDPIENCAIDLVANKAKEVEIKKVLSNSFGFGGTNASLVFEQI